MLNSTIVLIPVHTFVQAPKKEFQGVVCEIIGGEALMVKVSNSSEVKKIFLSSIRSPKEAPK
jgi:ribosomal protein L21E